VKKTEIMIITPKSCKQNVQDITITLGDDIIQPSTTARNIGFTFDHHLNLNQQRL
jgi:hypothetical protein